MWPEILPPNILSLELVPQTVTDNTIVLILIISFYYCKFVIHFYSPRIQLGVRTLRPEVQNNSYNTDTLPEFTSPCGPCTGMQPCPEQQCWVGSCPRARKGASPLHQHYSKSFRDIHLHSFRLFRETSATLALKQGMQKY